MSYAAPAPAVPAMVPAKHKVITTDRIEKLASRVYWKDYNLTGAETLIGHMCESSVDLECWSVPFEYHTSVRRGHERRSPTFAEAMAAYRAGKFKPAKVGDVFGPPSNSDHWFRVKIRVAKIAAPRPVDVRLSWLSACEGLVYEEDGTVLTGVTGEIRDFAQLWWGVDSSTTADGGALERVLYVEMTVWKKNGLGLKTFIDEPDPNYSFQLQTAEVVLVDRVLKQLRIDVDLLHQFCTTDGVEDVLAEDAMAVGNRVCNAFRFDKFETHIAAAAIASEFFDKHSQPRPNDPRHVIAAQSNVHHDIVWLFRGSEVRRKVARSYATQLQLMHQPDRAGPSRFVASQTILWEWLMEDQPELFARLKAEANKGRAGGGSIVPWGATFVEMDGNLPSGESFCRQFLYGQMFLKTHFAEYGPSSIFELVDTFGYSAQLPQIARHHGATRFVTQKLSWNLINKVPHTSFWWSGLDGTSQPPLLATMCAQDDYCCKCTVAEVVGKSAKVKTNKDLGRCSAGLMLYGEGDGGGGALEEYYDRLHRLEKMTSLPVRVSATMTPHEVFEKIEADERALPQLQTHKGELYFELHRGTFTTHRRFKSRVFEMEELLRTAEALVAVAELQRRFSALAAGGADWQYAPTSTLLHKAWKSTLECQFHDALPGTSIEDCYIDMFAILERAKADAMAIITGAKRAISDVDAVVNTAPVPIRLRDGQRTGAEQSDWALATTGGGGTSVAAAAAAAAAGIVVAPWSMSFLVHGEAQHTRAQDKKITVTPLDGGCFRVTTAKIASCIVQKDGRISSYKLRCGGRPEDEIEHVAEGSSWAHWCLFHDQPLFWDCWDIEAYHLESPLMPHGATLVDGKHATVVVDGSKDGTVEIASTVTVENDVLIEQRLIFDADSQDIILKADVKNWANERSKNRMLKLLFGSTALSPSAHYGTAFGAVERPTHRNDSIALAKFEVCADRWTNFSSPGVGLTVANNSGMRGAAVHGSMIHQSVLRAPTQPDPTCDVGDHPLSFVLHPHSSAHFSDAGSVDLASSLSKPLVLANSSSSSSSSSSNSSSSFDISAKTTAVATQLPLVAVSCSRLHVTAFKMAYGYDDANAVAASENVEVIVRLYETVGSTVGAGSTITFGEALVPSGTATIAAHLTNGLEEDGVGTQLQEAADGVWSFVLPTIRAFEIVTIKFVVGKKK